MDEVQVDAVHRGNELRKLVESCFLRMSVEMIDPIGAKLLHIIQVRGLLPAAVIGHFMPWERRNAGANVRKCFVRYVNLEMPDGCHGLSFMAKGMQFMTMNGLL